jgi:hypothetical protein
VFLAFAGLAGLLDVRYSDDKKNEENTRSLLITHCSLFIVPNFAGNIEFRFYEFSFFS